MRTYTSPEIPSKTSKFIPKWMKTYKIVKRELRDFAGEFAERWRCRCVCSFSWHRRQSQSRLATNQCPRTGARFSKHISKKLCDMHRDAPTQPIGMAGISTETEIKRELFLGIDKLQKQTRISASYTLVLHSHVRIIIIVGTCEISVLEKYPRMENPKCKWMKMRESSLRREIVPPRLLPL